MINAADDQKTLFYPRRIMIREAILLAFATLIVAAIGALNFASIFELSTLWFRLPFFVTAVLCATQSLLNLRRCGEAIICSSAALSRVRGNDHSRLDLAWDAITTFRLRGYPEPWREDRTQKWQTLTLIGRDGEGRRRSIRIDNRLDGFDFIIQQLYRLSIRASLHLDRHTQHNLAFYAEPRPARL